MKRLIKKLKQLLRTKNHEHEIVYQHGFGYRCKYCGQPKNKCEGVVKSGKDNFYSKKRKVK